MTTPKPCIHYAPGHWKRCGDAPAGIARDPARLCDNCREMVIARLTVDLSASRPSHITSADEAQSRAVAAAFKAGARSIREVLTGERQPEAVGDCETLGCARFLYHGPVQS